MDRLRRLLLITFLESLATVFVERGVYFFGRDRLGFSDARNLWLALAFGAAYVSGALASHAVCRRWGEKPLLWAVLVGQVICHAVLAAWIEPAVLFVGSSALGLLNGLKWPVMESYVSAGRTPRQTARAVGQFNIAWASSVPLALVAAGPIISALPRGLFAIPGTINLVSLWLIRPLAPRPVHLPHDHPERLAAGPLARFRALLTASRWTMLSSYGALWVLAALMPRIFHDLGCAVGWATALAGLTDVQRLAAFVLLERWRGWHGRAGPLVLAILVMPAGFFMVLFGRALWVVLAGEVVFGLAAGTTYYAALYYAMVVEDASVGAGGRHEGLIGLGFAIGPAAGLVGIALSPVLHGDVPGTLAGIGPLFAVCAAQAFWAMGRPGRAGSPPPGVPPAER